MNDDQVACVPPCAFSIVSHTELVEILADVPGMQHSRTYFPSGFFGASSGEISCSNPVPPPGMRTKRLVMGAFR